MISQLLPEGGGCGDGQSHCREGASREALWGQISQPPGALCPSFFLLLDQEHPRGVWDQRVEDGVEGKRAELEVDPHGRQESLSREGDSVIQALGDTTLEVKEGWVE